MDPLEKLRLRRLRARMSQQPRHKACRDLSSHSVTKVSSGH
jgi:hypothetical protein